MFGGYNNRRWPGVLIGVFAAAVAYAATNWAAANLSALINRGARLHVPARSALVAAVAVIPRWRDPRLAWPPAVQPILPSARTYWLCAAAVMLLAGLAFLMVVELRQQGRRAQARLRRRSAVRAITPRRRHIRNLIIDGPTPNRLLLGRFNHRTLLATEDPSTYVPGRTPPDIGGPVMYLCPDRTRATDAALEAAVNWIGPAIIVTTQTDILFRSIGERAEDGRVKVFDPLNVSGRANASWTPLQAAQTSSGAEYVVDLMRHGRPASAHGHAPAVLANLCWIAAHTNKTLHDVAYWASDWPGEVASHLHTLLGALADTPDPEVAAHAKRAGAELRSIAAISPTELTPTIEALRSMAQPWRSSAAAAWLKSSDIGLEWLFGGRNTLYVVVPENAGLQVLGTALVVDLVRRLEAQRKRKGQPLNPRLLLLIDQASPIAVPDLARWGTNGADAGLQLATIWRSLADMESAHHTEAGRLVAAQQAVVCLPGDYDTTTSDYLDAVIWRGRTRASAADPIRPAGPRQDGPRRIGVPGNGVILRSSQSIRLLPASRPRGRC